METITLTLGDCAENHVGNQQIGQRLAPGTGFTPEDLERIAEVFQALGGEAEIVDLVAAAGVEAEAASVLVLRDGVDRILYPGAAVEMYEEQTGLEWDTKVKMYGRVVNKHARHNLCYADEAQEPDYENAKGRIIALDQVPILKRFKKMLRLVAGEKAEGLVVEGNRYYNPAKTGIGYHGDTERVKVIAVRLGTYGMPIYYQWYLRSEPVGPRVEVRLDPGDVYVMSEKAVGTDWKHPSRMTLRHATGCQSFVAPKAKAKAKTKG